MWLGGKTGMREMCREMANSGGLLESLLGRLFDKIEDEDAVALVGILYEHRIVLSRQYLSLFRQHPESVTLEPLEPQAASIVVADLFHRDCDSLFLSFQNDWSGLRESPRAKGLKATIQSHEFVERLEPWTSLP